MKTKLCPYCHKNVPYIEKVIQNYTSLMKTYRSYCEECRRLIDEKIIFNEKSEDFEFADNDI